MRTVMNTKLKLTEGSFAYIAIYSMNIIHSWLSDESLCLKLVVINKSIKLGFVQISKDRCIKLSSTLSLLSNFILISLAIYRLLKDSRCTTTVFTYFTFLCRSRCRFTRDWQPAAQAKLRHITRFSHQAECTFFIRWLLLCPNFEQTIS